MTSTRRAVATILACTALTACGSVGPAADRGAPGTLRSAIFARYDELRHVDALPQANGADRVDFSAVVLPYFKSITSLSDAAALLRANGFAVQPMPPRPFTGDRNADVYRSYLVAQLMLESGLVWRADLSCNIAPETQMHDVVVEGAPNCWLSTTSL